MAEEEPWRTRYYRSRVLNYISQPDRFWLNTLMIVTIIGTIGACVFISIPVGVKPPDWLMVLSFFFVITWMATCFMWVTFHHEVSKSTVAIFGRFGVMTMDRNTVSTEPIPILRTFKDERKDMWREKTLWRFGACNGVEKWPGADGGGIWPCWAAVQGSILEKAVDGKWTPWRVWSLNKGELLKEGFDMRRAHKVLNDSPNLSKAIDNLTQLYEGTDIEAHAWTAEELLSLIWNDKPYIQIAQGIHWFPYHFVPGTAKDLPPLVEQAVRSLKRTTDHTPMAIGYDVSVEAGGHGMSLPSHAQNALFELTKIVKDQHGVIQGGRRNIVRLEATQQALEAKDADDQLITR